MSNPLKELMERLGIDLESADVLHLGCTVEQEVARLRSRITDIPGKDQGDDDVVAYGLKQIRQSAKDLVKTARKQELELEMKMLDKPDDVDLGAEEHQHLALHLEEEQLRAEGARREGQALLRFCDIIDAMYGEEAN